MGRVDVIRPLYKSFLQPPQQLKTGNTGLWYDKFCDQWNDEDWTLSVNDKTRANPKLNWIKTVTEQPIGCMELLEESISRLLRFITTKKGIFGIFTTKSRFVMGLGRNHPVENGFAWHPTLGVPYLPGSSLKGLVRAWAQQDAEPPMPHVDEILGSAGKAGHVVFVDAIPVEPVWLEADVVTPHYVGWNCEKPPGDWRGPTPAPFLVTKPEMAFVFALLPARPAATETVKDVFKWLQNALTDAGAGAKTSVGYGRFCFDDSKTRKYKDLLDKEQRDRREATRRTEAQRTPEGRWSLKLEGKSEWEILDFVREHLEKEPLPNADERQGLARAVIATKLPEWWCRGKKRDHATKVGEAKLKARGKLVLREAGSANGK